MGLVVNLHFTCSTPAAEVLSERGREACLTVRPRAPGAAAAIRVPAWAPRASLRLSVAGREMTPRLMGPFVLVGAEEMAPGAAIVLRHALPERETSETLPGGRTFRLQWRGDQVVGIHPREVPLAIYPPWDGATRGTGV